MLPALASARDHFLVVNLREERIDHVREADPLEDYARSLNLEYRDIPVCGRWDAVAVRHLRALIDRLEPTLVHAHDVKASAYLLQAKSVKQNFRPRIVSTHHGVHGRPDWKTRLYESFYRRYLLKSFDRVLCVSRADYECLLQSGLNRHRLRLQLNGINGTLVEPAQRSGVAQRIHDKWFTHTKVQEGIFYFGVVGRLSAEKDHGRLLDVLSHLDKLDPTADWKCLIFGTGPLETMLHDKARQLGIQNRVHWLGYRPDVGSELAGVDLLLSFSKAEGLPINLIEAGWAATPVMATRVGGVTDLIPDDRYGEFILPQESVLDSAQRLRRCLSEEGLQRIRTQGRLFQTRVIEEFTQDIWMRRLEELYRELGVHIEEPKVSPNGQDKEAMTIAERLKSIFFTRLMLYPTSRLGTMIHRNRHGFRILMYHQFPSASVDMQEALAKQCAHMMSRYTLVTMTEIGRSLREGIPLPPNALAVTVDDGYRNFLCNGYPVFRNYRIPVTVYLVSGFIDKEAWLWWDQVRYQVDHTRRRQFSLTLYPGDLPTTFILTTLDDRRDASRTLIEAMKRVSNSERLRMLRKLDDLLETSLPSPAPPAIAPLDWSEIRFLSAGGVEFGAHTQSHPILSRLNNPTDLITEITNSKKRIEEELKRRVLHFCYPNGQQEDVNTQTFKLLSEHQFITAVNAEKGVNFMGSHPLWLRRIGVDPLMSNFNFEALLAGVGGSRSKPVQSMLYSS